MLPKRYNARLKKEENQEIIKLWNKWQEKRKKINKSISYVYHGQENTGLTLRDLAKLFKRSLKNVWLVIKRGY